MQNVPWLDSFRRCFKLPLFSLDIQLLLGHHYSIFELGFTVRSHYIRLREAMHLGVLIDSLVCQIG